MIKLNIKKEYEPRAKEQINYLKKFPWAKQRYQGVKAWRGLVWEYAVKDYLKQYFEIIDKNEKGQQYDAFDFIIGNRKVEIKSATENYYNYLMPKKCLIDQSLNNLMIGAKYNEPYKQIDLIGYIENKHVAHFPVEQNKGKPYYKVPLDCLIKTNTFEDFTLPFSRLA